MSRLPGHTGRWRQFLANGQHLGDQRPASLAGRPPDPHQRPGRGSSRPQAAPRQLRRILPPAAPGGSRGGRLCRGKTLPHAFRRRLRPLAGAQVVAFETASLPPRSASPWPPSAAAPSTAPSRCRWAKALGRVVDGVGRPLDGRARSIPATSCRPCRAAPSTPWPAPPSNSRSLDVGIRAINALLTVGRGQRMGLVCRFRRGQIRAARHDGPLHRGRRHRRRLIGERGREVKEFIEILGDRRHAPRRRRRRPRRHRADASPGRRLRHHHRRIFPRPGQNRFCSSWIRSPATPWPSAKSPWPSANRPPPGVIRPRSSPACRNWSSGPATAQEGGGRSPPSTPSRRRRRPAGSHRRRSPGHPRRPICPVPRTLADAGHYPAVDIEQSISRALVNWSTPPRPDPSLQGALCPLPAFPRPHFGWRLRSRLRTSSSTRRSPYLSRMEAFLQQQLRDERADFASSAGHLQSLL